MSQNKATVSKEMQRDQTPISISSDENSGTITKKHTVTKKGPHKKRATSTDPFMDTVSQTGRTE